jgi:tRNA(fMet)-specific endonuclease VapC
MKYMLDTNMLIYFLKQKPPSVALRIDSLLLEDEICMSFISFAELLKGAEQSSRKQQTIQNLDRLTRQIPVVYATNRSLCEHYAVQFSRLKAMGTPIGANDLWIACHALAERAVVVTNNTDEFARVSGLHIENWAIDSQGRSV